MTKKKYRAAFANAGDQKKEKGTSDSLIARWTKVVGISTIVLSLATILSAYFLWVTDETLRRTLEVNQRPWVSADVAIAGPLTFDQNNDGESHIPLKITLKNNGLALAQNIRVFPIFYAGDIPHITRDEIEETRCRKPRNDTGALQFTLFPGQTRSEIVAPALTPEEVTETKSAMVKNPFAFGPAIVVCISYRATINNALHFTTAFFLLSEIEPSQPQLSRAINLSTGIVPAERLSIMPLGSIAD